MINVKRPQKGQKVLQSIYDSVISIIDYLPTLTVRGDNYSTYVEHASNGTIIHSKQSTSPDQAGGKTYYAGSGITLSGNTINNAVTSGQFIEITSSYQINCTLTGGNGIEITPNGVINCTVTPGGGGGSYYADNFTLSTTSESGNTFCMYDVYPLITGGGGITVSRYGDAPLYPEHALGTIITCPIYYGSGVIGIIDGAEGTYTKYIALTGDIDYNAGTGISIDPTTRTINCTITPGGGGITNYVDNLTLSSYTSTETNDTFYLYDVLPLLTGGGGTTVTRYGDAPGNPEKSLGTIIASPVYLPSTGIAITDGAEGTYNKYVAITANFDYNAGTGISIDPTTRTINCTVEPGGGGNTYYVDNNTLSTQVVGTTSTFYVVNVSSLLTGAGGTEVYYYGTGENGTVIAGISSHVYLPSTGIAIIDGEEGTYNKYIAVTGGVSTPIQPGSGLISTAHADPNSNPYNPTITSITFDLSAHFYNDLISLSGRHNFGGGVILSSSNGNLVWAQNITKVSQLTNDAGYITSPGPAPTAYYADNDTLSTTDNGTKFYVRNISTLLTGAGGTTVYYYGTGLNNTVIAGISSYTYLPSTGIGLIDGEAGTCNKYIAVTGDFITSTWVADNFISGGSTGDHMYYNSQEKLLKCMLTGGDNIEIKDVGNYGYINCTLTGLDQLSNTPGFITTTDLPTASTYVTDNETLSSIDTETGKEFFIYNVSGLLTGAGGTQIKYYGTDVSGRVMTEISSVTYTGASGIAVDDNHVISISTTIPSATSQLTNDSNYITTVDIPPSTTYIGTSGIAVETILDENDQPTTSSNIYISADFYNTLTNPTNNTILSCNGGNLCWVQNTGGSTPTPTPAGGSTTFIFSPGIYQAHAGERFIIMCPTPTQDNSSWIQQATYYDFDDPQSQKYANSYNALATAAGVTPVTAYVKEDEPDPQQGFSGDGNIIIILPQNPTAATTVEICLSNYTTNILVMSVDGTIVQKIGESPQRFSNKIDYQTGIVRHILYYYLPNVSLWPAPHIDFELYELAATNNGYDSWFGMYFSQYC